jgi:hypothetical protein
VASTFTAANMPPLCAKIMAGQTDRGQNGRDWASRASSIVC